MTAVTLERDTHHVDLCVENQQVSVGIWPRKLLVEH
jgi:hypothetical protein